MVKDDDGDIPVRSGSALLFVRVKTTGPVVEIFAPLVKGITNRTRAAEVMSDLNGDNLFAKFFLNDDYVIAEIQMPASPFIPEQLEDMLAHMLRIADEIDEGLAERLSGRLPFFQDDAESTRRKAEPDEDDEADEDELPPELQAIIQIEAEGALSSGDREEAEVCEGEAESWAASVSQLRLALRIVVIGDE